MLPWRAPARGARGDRVVSVSHGSAAIRLSRQRTRVQLQLQRSSVLQDRTTRTLPGTLAAIGLLPRQSGLPVRGSPPRSRDQPRSKAVRWEAALVLHDASV